MNLVADLRDQRLIAVHTHPNYKSFPCSMQKLTKPTQPTLRLQAITVSTHANKATVQPLEPRHFDSGWQDGILCPSFSTAGCVKTQATCRWSHLEPTTENQRTLLKALVYAKGKLVIKPKYTHVGQHLLWNQFHLHQCCRDHHLYHPASHTLARHTDNGPSYCHPEVLPYNVPT